MGAKRARHRSAKTGGNHSQYENLSRVTLRVDLRIHADTGF
jgi:hypothetical protein